MLAQIKAGNKSIQTKRQNEKINVLQQFNQIILIMGENKIVITTEPKTFHIDLPKDAGITWKHEIFSII